MAAGQQSVRRFSFIDRVKESAGASLAGLRALSIPPGLARHAWLLVPLALTQLLQRLEHVVDNRFIGLLGFEALTIHNIQFNSFLIAQAIGLASATSALIFWKRAEARGRQGAILRLHFALAVGVATLAALVLFPLAPMVATYFGIQSEFAPPATTYLKIGIINMILQAGYAPLSAILIAADRRFESLALIAGILVSKIALGYVATLYLGGTSIPLTATAIAPALNTIALGTTAILVAFGAVAYLRASRASDGHAPFTMKEILPTWSGELGIAAVRSISPLIFALQLAKVQASSGFFVTYQMTLHLAYILCLPLLAGLQIAIRDDSAEASRDFIALKQPLTATKWFPYLLFTSLVPSLVLLAAASFAAVPIFRFMYGYEVPLDHQTFLPLYFGACMIGQIGNTFLIRIRAAKMNRKATLNFVFAELGVQIGLTQILLMGGLATPTHLSFVIVAYCTSYLALNWRTVREIMREVPA